ncbi:MAG: hypothetical protein K2Q18_13140 [Bdellovibrionales bacterium]|nr:hypothetical protein [Bdellovibrionales bacterium]
MKIKLNAKSLLGLLLVTSAFGNEVPSTALQKNVFKAIRNEMIRLDGEGLISRRDRSENFFETTEKLALSIDQNTSLTDFFSTFKRLDATYTNLHSSVIFPKEVSDKILIPWYKRQSIWMLAEVNKTSAKYIVDLIEDPALKSLISEGDEIIAINGRSISSWLDENFLFCKYPLAIQCQRMFESNLLSLNLSWKGDTDLTYSIKHNDKVIEAKMNFFDDASEKDPLKKRCDYKADKRYPGFKLIHLGFSACLYEKINDPSIALLRIVSFQYTRNTSGANPYKRVREEVDALAKVWLPNAHQYKNLIIDLLDNGGGNAPIPYYEILFKNKFQEQFYQIKKTPEFEDKRLRSAMIWDDSSHELQFQEYLINGVWDSLRYGEFAPPEPMFCADDEKACTGPLFEPKEHDFNGRVHLMVNERCVSSCDGFVWAIKQQLDADLYGFYQAADSTYSRLRIDAIKDDTSKGFHIEMNPQNDPLPKDLIVAQVVAMSRSTGPNGEIFSGKPLELKEFVPYRFNEFYPSKVLKKILDQL